MSKRRRKKEKKQQITSQTSLQDTDSLKHLLSSLIQSLKSTGQLTKESLLSIYEKKEDITLPLEIFKLPLGILECIVKYLKENKNLKFSKIAALLNRDQRTIWNSYFSAKKKHKARFLIKHTEPSIPVSDFANRKFSPLESISFSLKESSSLNYRTIAKLLNRNERNIWTAVAHAKKKHAAKKP